MTGLCTRTSKIWKTPAAEADRQHLDWRCFHQEASPQPEMPEITWKKQVPSLLWGPESLAAQTLVAVQGVEKQGFWIAICHRSRMIFPPSKNEQVSPAASFPFSTQLLDDPKSRQPNPQSPLLCQTPKDRDVSRLHHVKGVLIDRQTHEKNNGRDAPGGDQSIAGCEEAWKPRKPRLGPAGPCKVVPHS